MEPPPWWPRCSKEAFNTGLEYVARGLRGFSESRKGRRHGRRVGFPRFKARRHTAPSIRFTTGAFRVEPDRHHLTLPRLGTIKTHESTRKLGRRLESGMARIMSATVRRDGAGRGAGRWHCSFTVEVVRTLRQPARPAAVVGVDVGIIALAVASSGDVVANPRHLTAATRRLRSASRTLSRRVGPDRRSARPASARWEMARRTLARRHARVRHLRRRGPLAGNGEPRGEVLEIYSLATVTDK